MSRCGGPIKAYEVRRATLTEDAIVHGFKGILYLCDVHLAEREREERAKAVPERRREERIYYREASILDPQQTCADHDRDQKGLPERPPARASYWDDLFRDLRSQELRDTEAVALNENFPNPLRFKAKKRLEAIAKDPSRAEWLRKMAVDAVDRINRSQLKPEVSS